MQSLLERLNKIEQLCAPQSGTPPGESFDAHKKKVYGMLKQVKAMIDERESLLSQGGRSLASVKLSVEIRRVCSEAVKELGKMEKLAARHPDEKESAYLKEKVETMREAVNSVNSTEGVVLHGGKEEEIVLELPNIDHPRFQQLRQKDAEIDAKLDKLAAGMQALKAIAEAMGEDVGLQNRMHDELHELADRNFVLIEHHEAHLRGLLNSPEARCNFVFYFILSALLLSICLYIYNLVR